MQKTIVALAASAFLALGILAASGQAPVQTRGVLSVLHVGQQLSLKETSGRYEVSVFKDGPDLLSHKVVEVGGDYLVVQDVVGVIETRIPIFSIKAILTVKLGGPAK
jgi:hypothetical protein